MMAWRCHGPSVVATTELLGIEGWVAAKFCRCCTVAVFYPWLEGDFTAGWYVAVVVVL